MIDTLRIDNRGCQLHYIQPHGNSLMTTKVVKILEGYHLYNKKYSTHTYHTWQVWWSFLANFTAASWTCLATLSAFSLSEAFHFEIAFSLASLCKPANSSISGNSDKWAPPSPGASNDRCSSSTSECVQVATQSRYHAPPFKCLVAQVRICPSLNIVAGDFWSSQLLRKSGKSDFLIASFLYSSNVTYLQENEAKVNAYQEVTAIILHHWKELESDEIEIEASKWFTYRKITRLTTKSIPLYSLNTFAFVNGSAPL